MITPTSKTPLRLPGIAGALTPTRPYLATLLLLATAFLGTAAGSLAQEAQDTEPPFRGFREAVLSVDNLDVSVQLLRQVGQWRVRTSGPMSTEERELYGPAELVGAEPRTALLMNPGSDRGWIRLVEFPEGKGERIRPSGRTWDTGGIFNVNLRVADIHKKTAELRSRGWHGYSEPIQFSFSQFVVWEVLLRGPHDEVLALIQRVEPPLEGWPHLRETSRAFNSTQIVSDFERAKKFYTDTLGWKIYFENEGPSQAPGPNVLGLPHDLTTEIVRRVAIVSPNGANDGSVEILWFEGARGEDFSARARAPHRGWLALRIPVDNARDYADQLLGEGARLLSAPKRFVLEPYGEIELFAVATPDGARLEFFEWDEAQR